MLTCKRCDAPTEMRWDGLCRKCYIPPTTPGITEHLEIDLQAFQPKLAEKLRKTLGVNIKAPIPNLTEDELTDFQEVVDAGLTKDKKEKKVAKDATTSKDSTS
jgi:hypothetical protein